MEQTAKEHYTDLMLSYRHAFHAAGTADVLKHSTLAFCLNYMTRKEKPLLCVDTHAGAGSYALHEGYAARTCEWKQGVGKLRPAASDAGTAAVQEELPYLLQKYLELCFPENTSAEVPTEYPGSPLIMARLLRPLDRLVCCELHPADYVSCRSMFEKLPLTVRAEVHQTDGFTALKGLLPPPSRRGLVLIDPSYEVKNDYERLVEAISMALRHFATGTYMVWYPLLKEAPAGSEEFPDRLMALYQGNRCRVELYNHCGENSPRGMYGSGLIIYNQPWTLASALTESLPALGTLIGTGEDGWKLEVHESSNG